ncbi:MAG: hypothetical protein EXX96DRAFT_555056 [Benjaminiella poitrasii]|nr:MAG: hypothetical protein EXX96DRAFT_555056 [Benjaminiella poitrasii]
MMALFYNISEMCCRDSVAHHYDLSSLTLVYNIGSKLYHSAIDILKKKYGFSIIDTYGLTETLIMFQNSVENTKKGSSGRLLGGYEARLVNAKGEDVGPGETGQLCVKGPTVCLGYFNDPSATAAIIGPEEGYIYTGDLLRCDERGLFYYVDRYKDMIRYYESSIFPSSIESVLLKHPKVLECAVVGLKIPAKNIEVPRAYVRLATCDLEQHEVVKQDITQFVDNSLPDEMRLRGGLFIVESFPRTYSGKIQRYTLKVEANKMKK